MAQGEMRQLISAFAAKGKEFESVLKMGRTQLQDAVRDLERACALLCAKLSMCVIMCISEASLFVVC